MKVPQSVGPWAWVQRMQYKLAVTVHRCVLYWAPRYLADNCAPVSEVSGRQNLRSATHCKLNIPRFRRNTFGTVCGLSQSPVWQFGTHCLIRCVIRPSRLNVLGGTWKHISYRTLETRAHQMCHRFTESCYTNRHFLLTYLLTYLSQCLRHLTLYTTKSVKTWPVQWATFIHRLTVEVHI